MIAVVVAIVLWAAIALLPLGSLLEASLLGHVLVEIPLLVAVGTLLGATLARRLSSVLNVANAGGIPGILLASFALAFWMIPRWLDASLADAAVAVVKYVSLPLLVGVPLVLSWRRLHPIARGVVKIEFLTMLFRLGWIYLIAPDRLCNNYLLNEQEYLAQGFILLGFALGATWVLQVLLIPRPISMSTTAST